MSRLLLLSPLNDRCSLLLYELDHCLMLTRMWHLVRKHLEDELYAMTKDKKISGSSSSRYKYDIFQGHCEGEGGDNYTQIQAESELLLKIPSLYGEVGSTTDMKMVKIIDTDEKEETTEGG
jgi:hypothetical protein